jgi:hypothetical protein
VVEERDAFKSAPIASAFENNEKTTIKENKTTFGPTGT